MFTFPSVFDFLRWLMNISCQPPNYLLIEHETAKCEKKCKKDANKYYEFENILLSILIFIQSAVIHFCAYNFQWHFAPLWSKMPNAFILKTNSLTSGLISLSALSLIAGPLGDVTHTGTCTGQRREKGRKCGVLCRPLATTLGNLMYFILFFTWKVIFFQ